MNDTLADVAAVIRDNSEFALACHVSPDGDALGSMLALHLALQAADFTSVASFSQPFEVAPHYRSLPGLDRLTHPEAYPAQPKVMITLDSGSLGRLGDLGTNAQAAENLIVLDHHVSNTRYGTLNVIDDRAAATAVMVFQLIQMLDLPITDEVATCLYAGLVCDTGRFQYQTTTPEVFEMAAQLSAYKVDIPSLSRELFEEHRFAYLQLTARVLAETQLDAEKHFASAIIRQADLEEFGVTLDETEGLIDLVRRIQEADVFAVLKEEPSGRVRVSLRGLGSVDVQEIAQKHGGGGHSFAAGFTSDGPAERIVESIRASL
ncbi:MAG: bifunctional oligoribonuclease/PAP phosphatase NrnA [Acidimicrobiia bacterium]|jgi:phosphoesterase RecJ-like protein|nr:bifunctional oligoribonuclease/PAP phosphatase NrnA [Acidimicrobiia bacterium]MBP8181870.1 bifunctional oligoribonuclease/PAP phosphatase NrnA [Acidimicrobiia bacterium]